MKTSCLPAKISPSGRLTACDAVAAGHELKVTHVLDGRFLHIRVTVQLLELARRRYIPHYFFARIYTALGEFDRAFEQLDKSLVLRESWVQELPVDPQLDLLRADPRFPALLARLQPRVRGMEEAETATARATR